MFQEAIIYRHKIRQGNDGGWAEVEAIEGVVLDTPQMVYNFTVRGIHFKEKPSDQPDFLLAS